MDELQKESLRLIEESHTARMQAIELMNSGKEDMKTRKRVDQLFRKAQEADRAFYRVEKKKDALLGI